MIPRASSVAQVSVIPTGLPQLDKALGIGGIPFKRITEISGAWSVGKTTLALSIVREAQRMGYECIWNDCEWAWDNLYARTLGVDTDKLGLLQTRVAEDSLDAILEYVEKGKNTLIVIDAVGALHPREESEKESGGRTIGLQSALIARFCRKIVPMLSLNNNALIVLNHEYEPIGQMGPPTVKTSGGKKLEYHKSIWIRLKRTGINIKVGDTIVGYKAEAEIRKNKLAPSERQKCSLEMEYGKGFLASANLLDEALEKGVITKVGNTHYFLGEKLGFISKVKERLTDENFAAKISAALGQ